MPLSTDDLRDRLEVNIKAWEEMLGDKVDDYGTGYITALRGVLDFINKQEENQ